jgi:hypothetical protein
MIDRTTFDLRIADHGTLTAQANRDGWQHPEARTHRAGQRGGWGLRRRVAGLATTATVGLALLAGVVLGQTDVAARATASAALAPGAHIWTGTCRAGSSDCLPGDDDTVPGLPHAQARGWTGACRPGGSDCTLDEEIVVPAPVAAPHGWTGSCRPGGSDCVPDEDILAVGPAQVGAATHGDGPADEYTQMLNVLPAAVLDTLDFGPMECGAAPCMSVPASAVVADQFTYREDHRAARPTDASVTAEYRWAFGSAPIAQRPVDASTATDYRWDFGASAQASVASFLPGITGLLVYA